MRGYLLDTNVLSEYNRAGSPHPGVVRWIETTHESLQYISVLTLAEIEKGILRMEGGKRRREFERWFDQELQAQFAGRILSFDRHVASYWARVVTTSLDEGRPLPTIDSQIAATALAHDLALVTRNVRDFVGLGLTIVNPWV